MLRGVYESGFARKALETISQTATGLYLRSKRVTKGLFELLLGTQLVSVSALLLPAVRGTRRETGIAPARKKIHYSETKEEEKRKEKEIKYFLQTCFSQLNFLARAASVGSKTPPLTASMSSIVDWLSIL